MKYVEYCKKKKALFYFGCFAQFQVQYSNRMHVSIIHVRGTGGCKNLTYIFVSWDRHSSQSPKGVKGKIALLTLGLVQHKRREGVMVVWFQFVTPHPLFRLCTTVLHTFINRGDITLNGILVKLHTVMWWFTEWCDEKMADRDYIFCWRDQNWSYQEKKMSPWHIDYKIGCHVLIWTRIAHIQPSLFLFFWYLQHDLLFCDEYNILAFSLSSTEDIFCFLLS